MNCPVSKPTPRLSPHETHSFPSQTPKSHLTPKCLNPMSQLPPHLLALKQLKTKKVVPVVAEAPKTDPLPAPLPPTTSEPASSSSSTTTPPEPMETSQPLSPHLDTPEDVLKPLPRSVDSNAQEPPLKKTKRGRPPKYQTPLPPLSEADREYLKTFEASNTSKVKPNDAEWRWTHFRVRKSNAKSKSKD